MRSMQKTNPDSQARKDTKLHRRQRGKAVLLKEVQEGIQQQPYGVVAKHIGL